MFHKYARVLVSSFALLIFSAVGGAAVADDMKMPASAADHEAMARSYKDQAASFRKTSEDHKKMAVEYKKTLAPGVKGQPNPWGTKMSKHCMVLSKDAEKMAVDADKAADFHTFRAREIEAK